MPRTIPPSARTSGAPPGPCALLCSFSWQELRQHPWRNAAAVVSVMLGVALAFSVHLINAPALDEFSHAVRSLGGHPALELRSANSTEDVSLETVRPLAA